MPTPLPTMDDVTGWAASAPPVAPSPTPQLPTTNELFSTPQAGQAHDDVWSSIQNAGARIINAAGYGFESAWGGRPVGLSDDDAKKLGDLGVLPDYETGHTDFFKSLNEAVVRPAATIADELWTGIPAIAGGASAGLEQTAEEISGGGIRTNEAGLPTDIRGALAMPFGMAGELASGVTKGYYGELPVLGEEGAITSAAAREARAADATAARSVGVLGEGEKGFYEAEPVTPENATARTDAAHEAGIEPAPPEPPAPDVHELARRIDPDTFEQYDALNAEKALHRATLASLGEERALSPEAVAAQNQVDTILARVNNVPSRLTNVARERLDTAQATLDSVLNTDTPEMTAARNRLMEADYGMRDLAPDVSAAYRQAREIAPEIPEEAEPPQAAAIEKEGAPEEAAEMVAEDHSKEIAAVGAAEAPQAAEIAPADVTGGQKLGEGIAPEVAVPGRTATGFNGLRDRQGNPIRFKGDQGWLPGRKVNVGFMKGLNVEGMQTAGGGHEASYILTNDAGEVYSFVPNRGISRLDGEDASTALGDARQSAQPELAAQAQKEAAAQPAEGAPAKPGDNGAPTKPPTAKYGNLRAVQGTGETVTRGLSAGVEARAIEKGLTANFGDLPEYERVSMADQARQTAELIDTDYETAKEIAMGDRQPPKGLLPESVFVGVEKRALADGDVETLRALATRSRLNTAATTMGQRIRTLGERDPTSPVGAIQAVQAAREAAYGKGLDAAKAAEVASIREELRAAVSKPDAWKDLVQSLTCRT